MPSRDNTGKRLSGSALRKRKKVQDEEIQQAETKRKKKALVQPTPKGLRFEDLEPPNLAESAFHVAWWNKALMICADMVIRDDFMPLEKKLKFISDFAAKAGMLRDKAAEQEKIKRILAEQKGPKATVGLEDVSKLESPRISRPAG